MARKLTKYQKHRLRKVKKYLSDLKSDKLHMRSNAITALGYLQSDALIPLLSRLLKDPDSHIRRLALGALSDTHSPRAVEPLVSVFNSDAELRSHAAVGLGKIPDSRAFEVLLDALSWENCASTRGWIIYALSNFQNNQARDAAIHALKNAYESDERSYAVLSLQGYKVPTVIEALVEALKDDKDFGVRCNAFDVLLYSEDKKAHRAVVSALQSNADYLRRYTEYSISSNQVIDAVEPLIGHLSDERWEIQLRAIRALGELKDARAIEPLRPFLDDGDREIRAAAICALALLKDKWAFAPIVKSLSDDMRIVRTAAATGLGELSDTRAVDPLLQFIQTEEFVEPCKDAVKSLGKLGDVKAVQPLIELLFDNRDFIWLPEPETEEEEYEYSSCTYDEDWEDFDPTLKNIKREIAEALGEVGDKRAVEPLIDLVTRRDESASLEAMDALGKLGDSRAVKPLCDFVEDPDSRGKVWAISALGDIGDETAVETLLSALDYLDDHVHEYAIEALSKLATGRAHPRLIEALHEPGPAAPNDTFEDSFINFAGVDRLVIMLAETSWDFRTQAVDRVRGHLDSNALDSLLVLFGDKQSYVDDFTRKTFEAVGFGDDSYIEEALKEM